MRLLRRRKIPVVASLLMLAACADAGAADDYMVLPGPSGLLPNLPDAVVDLRTKSGADMVRAQWRFRDARVKETVFRGPGPDLGPTGAPRSSIAPKPRVVTSSPVRPNSRFAS